MGGPMIGDAPYREVAAREDRAIERASRDGGLVPDLAMLASAAFDPARLHPAIRELYEQDPRLRAQIHAALGAARTTVNVGAGTGSYEPADRYVLAVAPSDVMAAQPARAWPGAALLGPRAAAA